MKKSIVILSVLVLGTIGTIVFINNSNDHKECSTTVEQTKDVDGNVVMTEKHICKEKYNL